MNVRERIIQRHRCHANDVRLAPIGENAACNYSLMQRGGAHVLRLSPERPDITYYAFSFGAE